MIYKTETPSPMSFVRMALHVEAQCKLHASVIHTSHLLADTMLNIKCCSHKTCAWLTVLNVTGMCYIGRGSQSVARCPFSNMGWWI